VRYREVVSVLGIDPASGRVLNLAYRGSGAGGAPADAEQRYSDFRSAGALTLPYAVERLADGEALGSGRIQGIEIDPELADSDFARPAGSGDAAGDAAGDGSGGR
jgi:hypothetical protein